MGSKERISFTLERVHRPTHPTLQPSPDPYINAPISLSDLVQSKPLTAPQLIPSLFLDLNPGIRSFSHHKQRRTRSDKHLSHTPTFPHPHHHKRMASSISSNSTRLEKAGKPSSITSQLSKVEIEQQQKSEFVDTDVERQDTEKAPAISRNAAILLFIG